MEKPVPLQQRWIYTQDTLDYHKVKSLVSLEAPVWVLSDVICDRRDVFGCEAAVTARNQEIVCLHVHHSYVALTPSGAPRSRPAVLRLFTSGTSLRAVKRRVHILSPTHTHTH